MTMESERLPVIIAAKLFYYTSWHMVQIPCSVYCLPSGVREFFSSRTEVYNADVLSCFFFHRKNSKCL